MTDVDLLVCFLSSSIFCKTYWFRFWKLLQKEVEKDDIQRACHAMEVVAMVVYAKNGWRTTTKSL